MVTSDEKPAAFAASDMYSNAFGFYSHISGGVDPRTGMYSAKVDLTTGEGNRLRGPHFVFRLSYSPLDTRDDGFGVGWRLGTTELDTDALMLTLSDGEPHKVTRFAPDTYATFPDRKLNSFTLRPGTDLLSATVTHATGVVELLGRPYTGGPRNPLRTTRIVNPNGDALRLEWTRDVRGNTCLARVADELDTTLLEVNYIDLNEIVLRLYIGQAAPLDMHFHRVGDELKSITIPAVTALNIEKIDNAADEARWAFDYIFTRDQPVLRLLKSISSPDGVRDEVTYSERALQMPNGAPRAEMPAVLRHERRQAAATDALFQSSTYDYELHGRRNFYGYPVVQQWENRNDQLLHWGGAPFEYGSTETQSDGNTTLCIIERTYNHFHLATREKTTRGNLVQETVITYGTLPNESFENQPKAFQLPHKVVTTVYDKQSPDIKQITVVDSSYDDEGNLLTRSDSSSGTTEVSVYYPVTGAENLCPPDPLGMVRRLRSRTIEPGPRGGPVLTTTYQYRNLPVLNGTSGYLDGRTVYVQAVAEIVTQEGVTEPLTQSTQTFYTDQGDQHGALQLQTHMQDGLTQTNAFAYRLDGGAGTITNETTSTTHDGIVTTSTETKQLVSGLVISATDALGNRVDYDYDALGRVIREVQADDAPEYRTETRWQYQLSIAERWVQRIGFTGLTHRTWMDEQGRTVRVEEPLEDNTLMTVREVTYDVFGQPSVEVIHDLLPTSTLSLRTASTYDDWGQPSRVTAPDGSVTVSERKLVEVDGEVMIRTCQWQETAAGERLTGWQTADVDAAGQQRCMQVGSWNGSVPRAVAAGAWDYDGLGRCIAQTDAMGLVTQQRWDTFDRLVGTTLPNGDVVTRSYAPGQDGDLLANIAVTPNGGAPIVLGTREYDGLGRPTTETAGSLVHRFAYVAGQMNAATRQLPGGGTIRSTYDRRLGEVLTTETLDGQSQPLKTAVYNKRLGMPVSLTSDGSNTMTIRTDYLGRMHEQDQTLAGAPPRSSKVTLSLGGLELTRTLVDGAIQTLDYDDLGRLIHQEDGDAIVTFAYDALSRLEVRTTVDARAARSIEQRVGYDDLGRMERTVWTHDDGNTTHRRALALIYRNDNKVIGKRWLGDTDSQLLREEAMDYDARGRLIQHTIVSAAPGEHPVDDAGNAYRLQCFEYDALDNLLSVETTLTDERVNTTRYTHDASNPDQVIFVASTLPGYPGHGMPVRLRYDDNGHLTDDGQGHTLAWDDAGRLTSVTLPDSTILRYGYGPSGRIASVDRLGSTTVRYHDEGALYCEFTGDSNRRFIRANGVVVAETLLANALRKTWLLGSDPQGSVLTESRPDVAAPTTEGLETPVR